MGLQLRCAENLPIYIGENEVEGNDASFDCKVSFTLVDLDAARNRAEFEIKHAGSSFAKKAVVNMDNPSNGFKMKIKLSDGEESSVFVRPYYRDGSMFTVSILAGDQIKILRHSLFIKLMANRG